uniref:Uncharacterized protein n=1 Tax=Grammatophora oceanica TaxID=210454 RepID=A0A7S1VIM3_9STRA|eukprot:CAMPEP_0194044910 /NCGR_PEP_ID=MMETSP0009_2-20130614/16308_1 /TAXON_ID=210454 /ORGANISM="Grammatophora oceanica, Strain CCMP 410" /LENGTH=189 /DNA_ID=CAMNT_0038689587 /DNA_START=148 /DNA_END=717 /DNA_ORIENTATION=+
MTRMCGRRNVDTGLLVAVFMTLVALTLSLTAAFHCDFMRVKLNLDSIENLFQIDLYEGEGYQLGIFSRQDLRSSGDRSSCQIWNENDKDIFWDSPYKTAISFAIISAVVGAGCLVALLCSMWCFDMARPSVRVVALLLIFVGICQGLVFVVFATDLCDVFNCHFSAMAGINIAATLFWWIASFFVFRSA